MKAGEKYKIDTYRVSQYEGERIVDTVEVIQSPTKSAKKILCYSPKLRANILVFRKDLKT